MAARLFAAIRFRDRKKKREQQERTSSAEGGGRTTGRRTSPNQQSPSPQGAQTQPSPAPTTGRAPKKDFIANVYHEDVVEHAMDEQKKGDGDSKSTVVTTSDNRAMWAQNLILKKPIRALAKEFAANKKIKPSDYTTEAYEKNDAKNRYNDIICIDATRVVLKDRPPEDDYIHASWMSMPDGQKYICTQVCRYRWPPQDGGGLVRSEVLWIARMVLRRYGAWRILMIEHIHGGNARVIFSNF
ncbi:hypothetical protein V3C99_015978 [Haemonchus contortus]